MAEDARSPRSGGLAWRGWDAVLVLLVPALLAGMLGLPWLFGEQSHRDGLFYQAIALKAAREGHWWALMQGDAPFLLKPPLGFWMHAAFDKLLGAHDWVFGLPELLVFAGCCALTASIAAKFHGKRVGVVAGCLLAVCGEWWWRIPNFRLDFLHTLLLLGAVRFATEMVPVRAERKPTGMPLGDPSRAYIWASLGAGVCIGLALMTKPIFALLLIPMLALWMWWCGERVFRGGVAKLIMFAAALAVALPWHVAMMHRYGHEFVHTYWTVQSYERLTGERFGPLPWYWYAKYLFVRDDGADRTWTLAMTPIACLGLGLMWRRRRTAPFNWRAGDRLALIWTLGWFVLLSAFPGKHNYYLLIVYPGLAWLAAIPLARLFDFLRAPRTTTWITAGGLAGMILVGVWRWPPIYRQKHPLGAPMAHLVEYINKQRPAEVWNGSLGYWGASLIYIKTDRWPRSPIPKQPAPVEAIPHGALVIYNVKAQPAPPADAPVVFKAGQYSIVRRP